MLNVVIFGAPGSGKGTQSAKMIHRYGLHHISTGEVLRDHIARARNLRDRARDMYRRQVGRTRSATGNKRGFSGMANERTRQKGQVLHGVVERLVEARDKLAA